MADCTKFYGFSENPFGLLPDSKFFFPSESHREALASLQYGIEYRKGFVLILGEAGIGKTMLIHRLMDISDQHVKIIYFPQSEIPFLQMFKEMLIELKLTAEKETKGAMMHSLYNHLIQDQQNENVVLVIDEAENIHLDLIEEVRLLANLETGKSKLLQIVLVGQSELREKLGSDIVRQIKQRIVISSAIKPLTEEESGRYIDHRLKIAGSSSAGVFTDDALRLICRYAGGIPLALNTLCMNALSVGCELSEKRISARTVRNIRNAKSILTPEKARMRASRIRRGLLRKSLFILPVLILATAAVYFGGAHVKPMLKALSPDPSVLPSIPETKKTAPEVKPRQADLPVPGRPSPEVTKSARELPEMPVLPPAITDGVRPEFPVKKIVEARAGINLSSLAYQYYKAVDETLIDHILKLNPEITNPNLILLHQKIIIPELTDALLLIPSSAGGFKIHLRTFADFKRAALYRRSVASWAKTIEIIPWRISMKETWHQVMAGPFANRVDAMRAIGEMKQKGFSIIPSAREKVSINKR